MARSSPQLPVSAADFLPDRLNLTALRRAAADCQGCPLFQDATQTVFGEGPAHAVAVFIGEQPGDQEDLAGRPFVGPAGALLDQAIAEAGIVRKKVYVTNAVKHFKWTPRGKRRLHAKPTAREVSACRPWLEAEIKAVSPSIVVCLGATAAQSLLGASFRITKQRGQVISTDWAAWLIATYHPSALLRTPDEAARKRMRAEFMSDLKQVADRINLDTQPRNAK